MIHLFRLLMVIAAISIPAFGASLNEIRIAVVASPLGGTQQFFGLPAYLAKDTALQSELAARHVQIKWVPVSAAAVASLVNEDFTNHDIDFAYYGDLPSVILNAAGVPTKLVAPDSLGNNVYLVVPPGSAAKSIADLKGKRIALHRGRPWEVSFGKLLAANHLTFNDFKIVNLNPQAGSAALAAGAVDAFFTLSDAYLLEDKKLGKIIWSSQGAPVDWKMRAELWGSQEFVSAHPDLTQLLVNAHLRALYWISQEKNRSSYIHETSVGYGYPESVLLRDANNEKFSWKEYWSPLYTQAISNHYSGVVAHARTTGLIRHDVNVQALLAPEFVDNGLKQLGLVNYWQAAAL